VIVSEAPGYVLELPRESVEILEQARAETYARGELWWLAETLRLSALAELRFGDPTKSPALFDEALRLAQAQGARLLVDRVTASA
jgi:hypothetical protein